MTGLTNEQVQERIAEGKVNVNENPNTRTYKQIILENTLTFFNFLNLVLLVLVLFVRSYKNSMFMGIILINTVIGIVQEIKAKKTLEKLSVLNAPKATAIRDGVVVFFVVVVFVNHSDQYGDRYYSGGQSKEYD